MILFVIFVANNRNTNPYQSLPKKGQGFLPVKNDLADRYFFASEKIETVPNFAFTKMQTNNEKFMSWLRLQAGDRKELNSLIAAVDEVEIFDEEWEGIIPYGLTDRMLNFALGKEQKDFVDSLDMWLFFRTLKYPSFPESTELSSRKTLEDVLEYLRIGEENSSREIRTWFVKNTYRKGPLEHLAIRAKEELTAVVLYILDDEPYEFLSENSDSDMTTEDKIRDLYEHGRGNIVAVRHEISLSTIEETLKTKVKPVRTETEDTDEEDVLFDP